MDALDGRSSGTGLVRSLPMSASEEFDHVEVTRPELVVRTKRSGETVPVADGWALKLLTGPIAGQDIALKQGAEYVFGRGREADVVLPDDLVSRRHATLSCLRAAPELADLASTNGTFVNGERITRATLSIGDRLLIGTTIARLGAVFNGRTPSAPEPRQPPPPKQHPGSTMAGRLDEVPPVDLIQLFSTSRKSGTLVIRGDGTGDGEVELVRGRLARAQMAALPMLTHRKALMRLLRVGSGEFEFIPARETDSVDIPEELQEPTELLLMDALRLGDEFSVLEPQLPAPGARLVLVRPMPGKLRSLEPQALDLVQLALEHETFTDVVDRSPLDDVEAVGGLLRLVGLGYLKVSS